MKKNPFLPTLSSLILLTFFALDTFAQIPSTFCDGNPADLANFTTNYPINGYSLDKANASMNMDNQFTLGSKDADLLSSWRWSLGSANAKGDITNAGAALSGANNCILRFFGDRTSDNGDASIGFWFFVNPVSLKPNGTFIGAHTNGDLLVLSDFTNGGTVPTISVYLWMNGAIVKQSLASGSYCAAVNQNTANVPAGFTYTASNGSNVYAPNTFYEGAINLCALDISSCFASFLLETRNSQSITASLQDLALGSFNATPPKPNAVITQPVCTLSTATITVTGPVAGYTYALKGTNPVRPAVTSTTGVFTNIASGTYALTATQGYCTSDATTLIVNAQPPTPATPSLTATQPTCTFATGSINVTTPRGSDLTYSLDGGNFVPGTTFSGLSAGSHCVRVKNSYGCISPQGCVTINAQPPTPARPVVSITEATLCGNITSPFITVNCPVTGLTYTLTQTGLSPKSITYSGSGTLIFNNLVAGKGFSITATNSSGCISSATDCSNYTLNNCPASITILDRINKSEVAIEEIKTTVKVYPNPFDNKINFMIQSVSSGKAVLDIYNISGQKISTLFQGFMQAGEEQKIEYNVPQTGSTNLVYVLMIGNEKVTGTLIQAK